MENDKKSNSRRNKILYLIFSVVAIIVIIFYLFSNVPIETFFEVITNFNWFWFIFLFVDLFFCMLLRGSRLKLLLKEFHDKVDYSSCVYSIFGSYYINTVSPARLGDVYNAYVLNRSQDIKLGNSVASIIVARISDMAVLIIFATTTILFHLTYGNNILRGLTPYAFTYLYPVFIMIVIIAAGFIVILVFRKQVLNLLNKVLKRLPIVKEVERRDNIQNLAKDSIDAVETIIKNKKTFLLSFLLTIVIIFLDTMTIFFITRAINFPIGSWRFLANDLYNNMPLYLTIMTGSMALLSLSFVILPGGIGQYELVGAIILENIAGLAVLPFGFTGFLVMFIEHLLCRAVFFAVGGNISTYKLGKPKEVISEPKEKITNSNS